MTLNKIDIFAYDKLFQYDLTIQEGLLYSVFKCSKCNMQFNDEKRLERHSNTHKKRELKGRKQKDNRLSLIHI